MNLMVVHKARHLIWIADLEQVFVRPMTCLMPIILQFSRLLAICALEMGQASIDMSLDSACPGSLGHADTPVTVPPLQ